MALYSYQAYTKDGKKVQGVIDASSTHSVKEQLAKQGLFPIKIEQAKEGAPKTFLGRFFGRRVSTKDKILFSRQLAVLLRSGVSLLQTLELLVEQFTGSMHAIVLSIRDDVKGGSSLADSMAKFPQVFDKIYIQLVRAGEATGQLDSILDRLTGYLERQARIRKKITGALQYPIIQLIAAVLVVVILLTAVVPRLETLFKAQKKELPWNTRVMLTVSNFIQSHYIILLVIIIGCIAGFVYWKRTKRGSYIYDTIKLKLPGIKYVTKTSAVVQFSYTLGILLEGGVNLAQALDIVVKIIDNRVLTESLKQARDKIIKQGKIAEYLGKTNLFPPIAIYLIRTGEESGQLDQMLLTVARNYEEDLTEIIDSVTGLLTPIMTIAMAVIVGFIVMAIAGPIMQAGEGFK